MSLLTTELLQYANAVADYQPTFDEKKAAAALAVPRHGRDTLMLSPFWLKSALFSAASHGTRARYGDYVELPAHPGFKVEFQGTELRQDDRIVLLALIKSRAASQITASTTFAPRAFCVEQLGWPDSSDSTKKLAACIERLHTARLRITGERTGTQLYSFVSDASMAPGKWTVWLSERLAAMFDQSVTYLKQSLVAGTTGLDSWLYGYVAADACFAPISRDHLRILCGLTGYSQKEFNRRLKLALEKLQAQAVITGFEATGDKLRITKN